MKIAVIIGIIISYFTLGGLATTNILRLLKGSSFHVYSSECSCPNCGGKITVPMQTPIISYLVDGGKCRYCKSPIPINGLILEIIIFVGMTLISSLLHFSFFGVICSFLYYEAVKIGYILFYGKRESAFVKQYILSFFAILFLWLLVEFMALLLSLTS